MGKDLLLSSLRLLVKSISLQLHGSWLLQNQQWRKKVSDASSLSSETAEALFFFFNLFIIYYLLLLFLAVLGLRFCVRAFSSCGKWGPFFIAMRGPLTIVASLVVEHRLQTLRLSSCGSRAQLLRGMWDLTRPGLEPVSPALAGRLSTTAPPGKPLRPSFKGLT